MPVTTGGYDTATPADITGSIDQAVAKYLAEARYTLQERPGVVKSSIRVETLPENQGPYLNIPKYATVNAIALTEGVDMSIASQITDTMMSIQPTEFGAQVILTDMMLMTVKDEFFRVAGRILADGYDRFQDQTLVDDFANFSGTIVGASGFLNFGYLMAGQTRIKYAGPAAATAGRGGEPGPDPITAVVTPSQSHALKKTLVGAIGAASNTQPVPAIERASYGEMYDVGGVTVKTDVNISKNTDDDATGAIFSKEAMILAELGGGPTAERQRDASLRAWEINFVGRWGRGEYNDAWGYGIFADSIMPTS
jgi:hypothetical protein